MELADLYDGSARDVARRHGVSRPTVMNWRRRAKVAQQLAEAETLRRQNDAVDLARAAVKERDVAERRARKAEAKAEAYKEERDAARRALSHAERDAQAGWEALAQLVEQVDVSGVMSETAHSNLVAAIRSKSRQLLDLRKREPWYQRACALGMALGQALPPSVWHALLAGDDVQATFSATAAGSTRQTVHAVDREAAIVIPDEALDVVRDFLAAYEAAEDTSRDDMVKAFAEQLHQVLY